LILAKPEVRTVVQDASGVYDTAQLVSISIHERSPCSYSAATKQAQHTNAGFRWTLQKVQCNLQQMKRSGTYVPLELRQLEGGLKKTGARELDRPFE